MENKKNCCEGKNGGSFKKGLLLGLLPHSFCLGFILFSLIGATTASVFLRRFLLLPYFFPLLLGISFLFATLAAILSPNKSKKYLLILYGTTIVTNLLFFFVIFPLTANLKFSHNGPVQLSLRVAIPCPGHAPLISEELQKVKGVKAVNFKFPNIFEINYERNQVSPEKILDQEIFKNFKASVI